MKTKPGFGRIACFYTEDHEGDRICCEVKVLWQFGPICLVRMERYAYDDMVHEHFLEPDPKPEFFKAAWNLAPHKLEGR